MQQKHSRLLFLAIAVFAGLLLVQLAGLSTENNNAPLPDEKIIYLSAKRANHILYGDARGGGHKFGIGKPCKSEFPQEWNDAEILDTVKRIAANDNLEWRRGDNGYYVTETYEERVKVRVVLDQQKQNIITAYPVNVKRNPCPANAP